MIDLDAVALRYGKARKELYEASAEAKVAAAEATASGVSEVEVARRLGVSRMTVRKWLGKDQT